MSCHAAYCKAFASTEESTTCFMYAGNIVTLHICTVICCYCCEKKEKKEKKSKRKQPKPEEVRLGF